MMAIMLECIAFNNIRVHMGIFHRSLGNGQRSEESDPGFVPFFEQKIQGLFRTFKDSIKCIKKPWALSFLVSPQQEQFHPEGLSVFAPFMQLLSIWVA